MTLFAGILDSLSRARWNFHRPYKASCEIASRVLKTESELRTLNLHVKVGQLEWLVKRLNPWSTSLNSLWGVSPSLGSWIWVSAAIQDLDHNNNRELVSRALTCSHIGILSFVCPMLLFHWILPLVWMWRVKQSRGAASAGPAVHTFRPHEAGAVYHTNRSSSFFIPSSRFSFSPNFQTKASFQLRLQGIPSLHWTAP